MDKFTDWHLYVGCPCRINGVGNYTLDGVWNGSLYLRDKGRVSKVFFDEVGCVKLVLRRLESMTEEEQREEMLLTRFGEADIDTYGRQGMARGLRYLLSKGFDLFGLIESGQAIDQATL